MSEIMQLIAMVTALVAVVLGPIVSVYIARRQIRATVVSSNRQVWINNLRDTIVDYLAKQAMVRNLNTLSHADDLSLARIEEAIRLTSRLELLVNPNKSDHAELIKLICEMTNTMNQSDERHKDFDVDVHRGRIVALSQRILKDEWDRVKSGD